jgi:hypothetical protein
MGDFFMPTLKKIFFKKNPLYFVGMLTELLLQKN